MYNLNNMIEVGESAVAERPSLFPAPNYPRGISPSILAGKNICDFESPYKLFPRIIRFKI
jgi:hypothetical protein